MRHGVTTGAIVLAIGFGACGGRTAEDRSTGGGTGGSGDAGGSTGTAGRGGSGGALLDASPSGGSAGTIGGLGGRGGAGGSGAGASCLAGVELASRPVDIILAADTSSTMESEIRALGGGLNTFVQRMVDGGLDPRLLVLAAHPGVDGRGLCPPPPLGSGSCSQPGEDTNLPRYFHHYSATVGSDDALNVIHAMFPEYRALLRTGSAKTVFVVSDGNATAPPYGSAGAFIPAFTALGPELLEGWSFSALYAFDECSGTRAVGSVFDQLAIQRGGASFEGNLCAARVHELLAMLADNLIGATPAACAWDIPTPPNPPPPPPGGWQVDRTKINLMLEVGDAPPKVLPSVLEAAGCDPVSGGWYLAGPEAIEACPATCQLLRNSATRLVLQFGCY